MNSFIESKQEFLQSLESGQHEFASTMAFVETWYDYKASAFTNGNQENTADQNQGSCKVLALSSLLELTDQQALLCFGEYFRDVSKTPDGNNHQNIRQLMISGLTGVHFESFPLTMKTV